MKKIMTISYQRRQGARNDRPTAPKLVIANHLLKNLSGLCIGDKVRVKYSPNLIIINKIIKTL
jgi:hypothetical protein